MECLVTFLLLMVVFLFVTGSAVRAYSVRARRRFVYEQLARRYGGRHVPSGFWRPGVRLRYGQTQATLRETARGRPFADRCTQLAILTGRTRSSAARLCPVLRQTSPQLSIFYLSFLRGMPTSIGSTLSAGWSRRKCKTFSVKEFAGRSTVWRSYRRATPSTC